jgi:hypothetical protein
MSLIAFVQSRIAMGAMHEVALHRVNKLARGLDPAVRIAMCAIDTPPAGRGDKLTVSSIELRDANAFVNARHRHLAGAAGHKFSIGAFAGGRIVGAAISGRPVARMLDDGKTIEILRVATDGTRNACSKLYGAVRRRAKRDGCQRIVTYTLPGEGGASLRAAGFVCEGSAGGGSWSRSGRRRVDRHPTATKLRWVIYL